MPVSMPTSSHPFFEELRARLTERPGQSLHLPGVSLREAAVLVPLLEKDGEVHLLFTRRTDHLRNHAGQISFPGGSRDTEDPTPLHAALRESQEELGLPTREVDVLGMLDESPTTTLFRIQPFVGVIPADYPFQVSAGEIAELIEVPLAHMIRPGSWRTERARFGRIERDVHFFDYGAHVIWGATARIVKNLFEVASDLPSFPRP